MTPQELKDSILVMAFQGQLTQQSREDSSIDQLIMKCKEDKEKAIKEGKYKKENFRGAIDSGEYLIPYNWCVMYISDMSLFQEGPGILAVDFREKGIPLIRISGMQTDRVTLDGCNYLEPSMVETKWKHFMLDAGDILISTSASMDKVCEVYDDCVGAIPYTGQIRFKMYGGISKEYFKWFVQSPFYLKQIKAKQAGAAIKHYGPTHLKKMTIPLAPLEEQKRIVAKIEELLPYIERYEKAWNKLEQFNKRFPEDMKKSLLQYAIEGKLVEQRPEEGTGEELFQQIQEEKQRLIREKKIKKEKPLPEITEEEKPFDIPENWKWVRLRDICYKITDGTHHSPPNLEIGVYKYITAKNIKDSGVDLTNISYVSQQIHEEIYSRCNPEYGDILLIKDGATTGVVTVNNLVEEFSMLSSVALLKQSVLTDAWYIVYVLRSDLFYKAIRSQMKGTGITRITLKQIEHIVIPIPPFAEQKRIVEKLEQLLPLCDRLNKKGIR